MDGFTKMLSLQLVLFMIMLVGVIARKKNIISKEGQGSLSNLLIDIILPCNIIASFSSHVESSNMAQNLMLSLIISIAIQAVAVVFGGKLFSKFPKNERDVMHYGLICSNSSFIGMPVADNIYGSIGVVYVSMFQLPIRFTMWTSGLALFTSVDRKSAIKTILLHPCIISMGIGIIIMAFNPPLPEFTTTTITYLSKCTIPLSMLIIGCILSDCSIREIFDKSALYFSLIRLVIFPLIVFVVLKLLHIDEVLLGISVIMSGMPAGSTTAILADKYDGDGHYASKAVFISTLLSMITVPILCGVL
ncbi:MAG: AEC family transporter [Candidatus Metalachnospira sp.]|nr:AEC family transporter [Candidatus Metalachnospira sp.]